MPSPTLIWLPLKDSIIPVQGTVGFLEHPGNHQTLTGSEAVCRADSTRPYAEQGPRLSVKRLPCNDNHDFRKDLADLVTPNVAMDRWNGERVPCLIAPDRCTFTPALMGRALPVADRDSPLPPPGQTVG